MGDRPMDRRRMLRITAAVGAGAAITGGFTSAVMARLGLHRVEERRVRMGTLVSLTVIHPDAGSARALIAAAFARMSGLESVLSRHRPDTPVDRLNRDGRLVEPPPELVRVLRHGQEVARRSGGAFDVTVLPLLHLWEASFREVGGPPTDRAVEDVRALVDYRALEVDDAAISLARPGMAISLDGIAKGYVVDRTLDVLVAGGAGRILVDAGGDMASGGPGSVNEPWRVGIQDPHRPTEVVDVVRLAGGCVATSGDYQRSFTDDRRYHHVIDPRTGRSPEAVASASVMASSAMEADALSTAVMVLGPVEGIRLLDATPGTEGLVVGKEGATIRSRGLAGAAG